MPTELDNDSVVLDDDAVVIDEADITEYLETNKKILDELNNSQENNDFEDVKKLEEDQNTILKDIVKNLTEINKDLDKTNEQLVKTNEQLAIVVNSDDSNKENNNLEIYLNVLVFFFTFIIGFLIVKAFFSMIHK